MVKNNRNHIYAWLLLTPALILMGLFTHLPSFTTFVSSFFSTGTKKFPSKFIGLENYEMIFEDPIFLEAALNNAWYAVATIIPSVFLAILMAVFVDSKIPGRVLVRMAYFTPTILPMIAVSNIWLFFYTPEIGLIDQIAINLGFSKSTAKILINETIRGSLNLLNSNNISAEKMVETVATRGGTTEAGIKKMKINKVDNIFNQVFKAAYTRAKQQGEGK